MIQARNRIKPSGTWKEPWPITSQTDYVDEPEQAGHLESGSGKPKGQVFFVSLALVRATNRRCGSTLGVCSISTGGSRNVHAGFVELSLLHGHPPQSESQLSSMNRHYFCKKKKNLEAEACCPRAGQLSVLLSGRGRCRAPSFLWVPDAKLSCGISSSPSRLCLQPPLTRRAQAAGWSTEPLQAPLLLPWASSGSAAGASMLLRLLLFMWQLTVYCLVFPFHWPHI